MIVTAFDEILTMLESGEATLAEAHAAARAIPGRKKATVGECMIRMRDSWNVDLADAAALAGTRSTTTFTVATPEQIALLQQILEKGWLRRPWRTHPWWDEPGTPF